MKHLPVLLIVFCTVLLEAQSPCGPAQSKVIVDTVKLDGGEHLSDAVREQFESSFVDREFDGGLVGGLSDVETDSAFQAFRNQLQDDGYWDMTSSAHWKVFSCDSAGTHVALTVKVDEGLQYRLGAIEFRATGPDPDPKVFQPEELRKLIPLQDGKIFRASNIREGLDALRKYYGAHGYVDFTAVPDTRRDTETQLVALVIDIDKGALYSVGSIEVFGLAPSVEDRLLQAVRVGGIYNSQAIDDFFKDNKAILPADASSESTQRVVKDSEHKLVDLVFDFRGEAFIEIHCYRFSPVSRPVPITDSKP